MPAIDLSDSKIVDTWNALGEKNAVDNWMLLNFVDKNKLQVLSKGKGGLAELKQQLQDDQVMFGILRVGAEDRKEALTSVRQKFMVRGVGAATHDLPWVCLLGLGRFHVCVDVNDSFLSSLADGLTALFRSTSSFYMTHNECLVSNSFPCIPLSLSSLPPFA